MVMVALQHRLNQLMDDRLSNLDYTAIYYNRVYFEWYEKSVKLFAHGQFTSFLILKIRVGGSTPHGYHFSSLYIILLLWHTTLLLH
jgi:hypothetical protein